jgi:hypothetical protein
LIRLVFSNSIKVSWPNASHLIDIIFAFLATVERNSLSSSAITIQRKTVRKTLLNLSFLQFIIIHVSDKFCWLVFVFLRLVAAIEICSHEDEYGQLIPGLNENYSLKDVSISISSLTVLDIQSLILPDPLLHK